MKRLLTVLLLLALTLTVLPFRTEAAAVRYVTLHDLIEPTHGYLTARYATSAEPDKYTVKGIEWSEYDADMEWQRDMGTSDTYVIGNYYIAYITLEAVGSHTFASEVSPIVNGSKGKAYAPTNGGRNVQIYIAFGPCKKYIERVDLTVVSPVVGKTPTFAKVETDEYYSADVEGVRNQTNGVTWTNETSGVNLTVSNPFKADTPYTVTYSLTAKENHVFTNTKYYINGTEVEFLTSNAGQTKVTVALTGLIAGDGKKEISSIDLEIPPPVEDELPSYAGVSGEGYASATPDSEYGYVGGIAWYLGETPLNTDNPPSFRANITYTLKVRLLSATTHKFAPGLTVTVNGQRATVTTNADGSVTVSIALTAAPLPHTHTPSEDFKYDESGHWVYCTDPACGEMLYGVRPHSTEGKCVCGYEPPAVTEPQPPVTEPTHTHTPSEDFKHDESGHWVYCTDPACGEMLYGVRPHSTEGKCVCGYEPPAVTESQPPITTAPTDDTSELPSEPTDSTAPDTDASPSVTTEATTEESSDQTTSDPTLLLLLGGAVIAVIAVILVMILRKKRK